MQCAATARPTRNHCCRCFARPPKFAGCWSCRDTCENRFCLFWKVVPRSPTTWYARPVELDVGASVLARAGYHEPRTDSCPRLSGRAKLDPFFGQSEIATVPTWFAVLMGIPRLHHAIRERIA